MRYEFYKGEYMHPFASARGTAALREGDVISIKGETYKVTFVNFAVDTDIEPTGVVNQRVQVILV